MTSLRVAIAGAGAIGRHHAKWHALAGSEVVAVLGRNPAKLSATVRQLHDLFAFDGRSYTDMAEMLRIEQPDVVDVCASNEAHFVLAQAALGAGCHVLCEKPFVWSSSVAQTLAQANSLVTQADLANLKLGMCSQYAACIPQYVSVHPDVDPTASLTFSAEMETLSRGQPRDATAIWIDMGPHPLSLILAAWPGAEIVPGSLRATFGARTAEADFTIASGNHRCDCHVAVRDRDEGPLTRRFAFDGRPVDLAGRADDAGVYRSVMTHDGVDHLSDDFMNLLIEQFTRVAADAEAAPLVPPSVALRNLDMQTAILAAV